MPAVLSYPGVYVEELPSGVHTITGVPTSIAAFVGPTRSGPPNVAQTITSFSDFERRYGGLWEASALTYAVQQFYANGGQQAVIVRVLHELGPDGKEIAQGPVATTIPLQDGPTLRAKFKGSWGNELRARVDYDTKDPKNDKLYNLTIRDGASGVQERYLNVEADPASPDALDRKLQTSALVVVDLPKPVPAPPAGGAPPGGAAAAPPPPADPRADLGKRPKANGDPQFGQSPWGDRPAGAAGAVFNYKSDGKGSDGSGGGRAAAALSPADYAGGANGPSTKQGIYALLDDTLFFNLLCLPSFETLDASVWATAAQLCAMKRALLLVDSPTRDTWGDPAAAVSDFRKGHFDAIGDNRKNAAVYFPRFIAPGPDGPETEFPPCGAVAGVCARTDAERGVWKAPAGLEAALNGVAALAVPLNNLENGNLNVLGVNCLRSFPIIGNVVWGARTLVGADALTSEWKYVPVRRLALFLEESLYRGSQWIVFEPNDEPLWAQIRLNFGAFMHSLFRQGAFQGTTPRDAYFVKCDRETTTQNDINQGIVNIVVGFAPLKPAEFVVIKIQQMAGQIEV